MATTRPAPAAANARNGVALDIALWCGAPLLVAAASVFLKSARLALVLGGIAAIVGFQTKRRAFGIVALAGTVALAIALYALTGALSVFN